MAVHVAILKQSYIRAILSGRKTIESRLSKTARPPYRAVKAGQRIFFKASGRAFMATAVAGRTHYEQELTPQRVDALRARFGHRVCAEAAYWQSKRGCRFASLIELDAVEAIDVGPGYRKSPYRAWFVLADEANPLLESPVTAAGIRNSYVHVPGALGGNEDVVLALPDGRQVDTQVVRGRRFRWRGWSKYLAAAGAGAGDVVRFVRDDQGVYRVSFVLLNKGPTDG